MSDRLCCVDDYERLAKSLLPRNTAGYYASGACQEYTLDLNKRAFQSLRIRPRMLRDVSKRSTATTILGTRIPCPIGVSPTAMQKLAHPDGETGNARAVGKFGSIFILSTLSTTSIEDVGIGAPDTTKWDITRGLVKRAEKSGFKALVLTVDACIFGKRYADVRNKFCLPPHLTLANFDGFDGHAKMSQSNQNSSLSEYVNSLFDDTLTWNDVQWLKRITNLPIILKGILTAEDAKIAVDLGIAAIIVSNHGARQLDTEPASIEALPEVVKAVGNKCEVYLDGGIRYGTDVFKAIALGAKMVFVGRPAVWGLSCNGENGVKDVLDILAEEFEQSLALSGCSSVDEITKDMVVHETYYSKL